MEGRSVHVDGLQNRVHQGSTEQAGEVIIQERERCRTLNNYDREGKSQSNSASLERIDFVPKLFPRAERQALDPFTINHKPCNDTVHVPCIVQIPSHAVLETGHKLLTGIGPQGLSVRSR